jgi:hypothetical protein
MGESVEEQIAATASRLWCAQEATEAAAFQDTLDSCHMGFIGRRGVPIATDAK